MKVYLTDVLRGEGQDVASESFISCPSVTPQDVNSTRTASEVIIASGAGIFYLALCMLSVLGVWSTSCARLCSSRGTFFVFFIGALLASVNVFSNSDNLEVKLYFRLSAFMFVGIAYTLFGASLFFSLPDEGENRQTLGQQQPSMGCVVGVVTFPIFLLEAVLLAFACTEGAKNAIPADPSEKTITWILIIIDKSAFFLQKPFQLVIYLYLRTTCLSRQEYKGNAEFYFRIMSFFNFIEWIDAQVNGKNDVDLSGPITGKLDGWFNVFVVGYKALIIDYRLLCCFLFLEHSAEIPNVDQLPEVPENEDVLNCMTPRDHLRMYAGFFFGCLCITAPVLCGLYFIQSLHIRGFIQVFAIIVNTAIFVLAAYFLYSNDLEEGEISESIGVKIMVCGMGAVGFTCWLVEAAIAGYWAQTAPHGGDVQDPSFMGWDSAKLLVRGLTGAFLILVFMKINARSLPFQNLNKKWNHLLVPVIMLGILSVFVETLLDQHEGHLDIKLRCEIKEESLKILLEVGPPMYLGFLIHVFLYFFILWSNLGKRPIAGREDSLASYSTFEPVSSSSYTSCVSSQVSLEHEGEDLQVLHESVAAAPSPPVQQQGGV